MVQDYFNERQEQAILSNIMDAENNTSGEVRVHIEKHCTGDPIARAANVFRWLEMGHTEQRNAVLIYIAVKDRKFAVVGDKGIHRAVPPDFWTSVVAEMQKHFSQDKIADGLCEGIRLVGEKLKAYFPFERGDKNELPDEISTN
jgi:uncharacterized membrane protein